jgi:hypothetical protein
LNRNLRDGNLFGEFALSVEFKDFVWVFVGKHDVTLVDLSSVGNSDIDNWADFDDLEFGIFLSMDLSQRENDRALIRINFNSNIINLPVESDFEII